MKLAFDRGGSGSRLLVLLHGLGATRQVWHPMLESAATRWGNAWVAPDLRGHGRSEHARDYSLGAHAADVAELISAVGEFEEIALLGHSMGGVIALALASGSFGFVPRCACAVGIKIKWSETELAQLKRLAAVPPRNFETQAGAVERYLKVSGLHGLLAPDSEIALTGVTRCGDVWRLAADPATAAVGPPDMPALIVGAKATVRLARGANDPMVTREDILPFDPKSVDLDGSHNVMVENPGAVWTWIEANCA